MLGDKNNINNYKRLNAIGDLQENSPSNEIIIDSKDFNTSNTSKDNMKRFKKSTPLIKVYFKFRFNSYISIH